MSLEYIDINSKYAKKTHSKFKGKITRVKENFQLILLIPTLLGGLW